MSALVAVLLLPAVWIVGGRSGSFYALCGAAVGILLLTALAIGQARSSGLPWHASSILLCIAGATIPFATLCLYVTVFIIGRSSNVAQMADDSGFDYWGLWFGAWPLMMLGNPICTVLAMTALAKPPYDRRYVPESKVGRLLHGPAARKVSGYGEAYAIETDAGIRIERRHPFVDGPILANVDCTYRPRVIGLWAITREKYDATLRIIAPTALSNEVQAEIRNAFADHLAHEADIHPPFVEWVRQGLTKVDSVFWPGYIHNCITAMVAMLVLVISFLELVLILENRRVRHAILAGRCPACGYDLRGSVSDVCSECGATVLHAMTRKAPRGVDA